MFDDENERLWSAILCTIADVLNVLRSAPGNLGTRQSMIFAAMSQSESWIPLCALSHIKPIHNQKSMKPSVPESMV